MRYEGVIFGWKWLKKHNVLLVGSNNVRLAMTPKPAYFIMARFPIHSFGENLLSIYDRGSVQPSKPL